MGAATFPLMPNRRDSLRGSLLLSILLHGLLFVTIIIYTIWGGQLGRSWGQSTKEGSAVHVQAVASLPGIPLPSPVLTTHSTVAVQNPGLYQNQPVPKPPPTASMQEIPRFKEAVKPEKKPIINKRIPQQIIPPPANAVPYGQGGPPTMSYSTQQTPQGPAGISITEQDFGDRFGWYVQAVRTRVSSNWLLTTISPGIASAPRVFVEFIIHRDGSISDAHVTQSSGIPEVDRSALRAVLASSPLAPLPPDYSGSQVSVQFYFDFHR